jgi:dUTP pyrophosphatase
MIGINGEKRKALGEVKNLPIRIQGQILPADVIVSEATGYDLLVGNDWLTKNQAVIDWPKKEFRFQHNNKTYIEPATCWKKMTVIEDPDDEFEEDEEAEYHLDLGDATIEAQSEGIKLNDDLYYWEYLEWAQLHDNPENEKEKEYLQQELELLTPEEKKNPVADKPGLTLKYFDNNGSGKQPTKAYETDAGLDLYYTGQQPLVLKAQTITPIDTAIAFEIPGGTYGKIDSRSSMAKKGINTVGGVCDAGYTGNIIVQLQNTTNSDYTIQRNDKIAQIIFIPLVPIAQLQRVESRDELKASSRQLKGFGSSDQQQLHNNLVVENLTSNQQKELNKL